MDLAHSDGKSIAPLSRPAQAWRIPRGRGILAGLSLLIGTGVVQAELWNLPYARPAAYDYSGMYSPSLKAYLGIRPDFFKTELQNAWGYYKQNFIMANGLVNHRRLENNAVVGTNEAVSEGQGYGTLLAVIMNDQTTFNRIFEAANAQMWDNGRKSYFVWKWPGGQGAAADADLDIGLALVFADAMEKAKLWQPYNKGGITYQSRAMDIIRSIKANMSSQNYLLPGDNWGGDGVNNLNPSYFSTAWLKVFDLYQKEVDFTAIINNSYAVLAKTPRYAFGQAPDWCNPNGGQASQAGGKLDQGLGMHSDAIRTPYRIAMDALWFNDDRAIAYCKNAKKTLTEYGNPTIKLMAAQMAEYDKNGQATLETKGSFDNVAMWSCAVMGSKDVDFAQKATNSIIIGIISGTSADYFGDVALQDDKFYFKQSLGMLGFAVIGGQFPNIFSDAKNPVSLLSAQAATRNKISLRYSGNGTPLWLSQNGIPVTTAVGDRGGKPDLTYHNALGQKAIPLP